MRFSAPLLLLSLALLFSLSCAPAILKPGLSPSGPDEMKWAKKTLDKMTLEEKIGQMIACRYMGRFVSSDSDYLRDLVALVRREKIGGLIIFGGEVYETAHLTNFLQEKAKIPLLIAADFEWGAAMRINGTTLFPPFMALGATGSEDLAYQMGKVTAIEGRAMGIHMTYAPVVDVNINPDNPIISVRSLGENAEAVSQLAAAFIKGCQENGLIATAKHFPGHGDTDLDSHTLLPVIAADRDRLEKVELYPFARAVKAGVEAIMTAHLSVPALDPTPNLPATLSYPVLTELLRRQMGFKGLIVTDALDMGGITRSFSTREAAVRAVHAGVDMLLLPPKPAEAIDALVQAVSSGEISESRINASVAKILELKARLGLHRNKLVDIGQLPLKVATKPHLDLAATAFEKSVTLVKNEADVLPLGPENLKKKMAVFSLSSDANDYYAGSTFVREMEKRRPGVLSAYADAFTGQEYVLGAKEKAKGAEIIIFALFSSLRTAKGSVDLVPQHIELVKEFAACPARVIVISFGSPYFLRHFPDVDAYICLYRNTAQAQETAARALFGEIKVQGRLPVSILGLYPAGHGIEISGR
ncbi:MAG: glycoside hydrolase family 3 N-terminal domain-containing protein [Clostridiales bacterium]|nr:glycoside hydrolase family 3 N-terminal domain-containing protein [Clostridiales bacterium]